MPIRFVTLSFALVAFCTGVNAQVPWATEYYPRKYNLDFYGIGEYLHQGDTTFTGASGHNGALKMAVDDTGLGGFGIGGHFSDYFSLHGDFLFGPATFRGQAANGQWFEIGHDGFLHSGRFNLDYNIINRRLTPFITAGIGYQYMQFDQGYGYNDGYYYYDHHHHHHDEHYYSETDFTWNVGAGIRWNITDNVFIRCSGGAQWLSYEDAKNVTTQIEGIFVVGYVFP